jgi:hypothetical protein
VDSKARVIGVKGLRVVDASAFAVLPPGHPQSTVCKFSGLGLGGSLLTMVDRCFSGEDCG